MKRIFSYSYMLFVLVLAVSSFSFADVNVATSDERLIERRNGMIVTDTQKIIQTQIPDPGATKAEVQAIAAALAAALDKKLFGGKVGRGKNAKTIEGAIPELSKKMDEAVLTAKSAAENAYTAAEKAEAVARELAKVPGAIGSNTTAIVNLKNEVGSTKDQIIAEIKKNSGVAIIIGIILALLAAAIIITILKVSKQDRDHESDIWRSIAKNSERILEEVNLLNTKVDEVPAETVKLINNLNPSPFEFDVMGYHISYTSPKEGILEGYYKTFKIEDMPDGPDHPESFEQQTEAKRGIALNYIRGTIKKFLKGKLKGTPQADLIAYLRKSGDIKFKKIN